VVSMGVPGAERSTNAKSNTVPPDRAEVVAALAVCPLLSARGCWRWCGRREDEPGWAISDRGLLQGLIGRLHRHWQA